MSLGSYASGILDQSGNKDRAKFLAETLLQEAQEIREFELPRVQSDTHAELLDYRAMIMERAANIIRVLEVE